MSRASLTAAALFAISCGQATHADGGSSGGSSGGVACTDAGPTLPWPGVPDAALAPAGFGPAFFADYCAAMAGCYPMADYLTDECAAALQTEGDFSFEECTAGLCGGRIAQPALDVTAALRALDAGRVAYDRVQAEACVESPWPLACDPEGLAPLPPASCAGAFVGLVSPGGACYLDLECDAGGCALDGGCPGRCGPSASVVPGGAGSVCGGAQPCASGLACADGWCWGGGAVGSACTSEHDCAPGAYCSPRHGFTCQLQRAACASCDENLAAAQDAWSGECVPGLFCLGLVALPDGGALQGLCSAPGAEGSGCVPGRIPGWTAGPVTGCLPGLDCIGGVCSVPPQSGPCLQDDAPCYIGPSFCFDSVETCFATTAGNCTDAQCVPGMTCIGGSCVSAAHEPSCAEP